MPIRLLPLAALLLLPLSAAPPRVLAWNNEVAARELALVRGKEQVTLEGLHPSKRSPAIRLRGEGKIFLRALDRSSDENPVVQRECAIGEGLTHPLLILMPAEKDPTGLRIVVFNDDPAGFRWGSYRFLNATPKPLALRLENEAVRLASGWKATDIRLSGKTRGVGAMIAAQDNLKKPLYSAVWEHDPDTRTLCFIVPGTDPRLGPIEIKAVPETRTGFELDQREGRAEAP